MPTSYVRMLIKQKRFEGWEVMKKFVLSSVWTQDNFISKKTKNYCHCPSPAKQKYKKHCWRDWWTTAYKTD